MSEPKLVKNKQLNIWEALIPVFALVAMLAYNVFVFQDDAISGSNQFVLLLGAAVAVIVGHFNKVSFDTMMDHVGSNLKSVSGAILILLLVGSLAAAWLVSGVIPAMIFYGIKLINPTVFLPTAVVISALISIATILVGNFSSLTKTSDQLPGAAPKSNAILTFLKILNF